MTEHMESKKEGVTLLYPLMHEKKEEEGENKTPKLRVGREEKGEKKKEHAPAKPPPLSQRDKVDVR